MYNVNMTLIEVCERKLWQFTVSLHGNREDCYIHYFFYQRIIEWRKRLHTVSEWWDNAEHFV